MTTKTKNRNTNRAKARTKTRKATTKARQANELEKLAKQFDETYRRAKALYQEADELQDRLIAELGEGGSVPLKDGRVARVVNNFTDSEGRPKAKAWRPAGIRILEVKVS